jgi:hypothetical protein
MRTRIIRACFSRNMPPLVTAAEFYSRSRANAADVALSAAAGLSRMSAQLALFGSVEELRPHLAVAMNSACHIFYVLCHLSLLVLVFSRVAVVWLEARREADFASSTAREHLVPSASFSSSIDLQDLSCEPHLAIHSSSKLWQDCSELAST